MVGGRFRVRPLLGAVVLLAVSAGDGALAQVPSRPGMEVPSRGSWKGTPAWQLLPLRGKTGTLASDGVTVIQFPAENLRSHPPAIRPGLADPMATGPTRAVDALIKDLLVALDRAAAMARQALPSAHAYGDPGSDLPPPLRLAELASGGLAASDHGEKVRRAADLGRQVDARVLLEAQRMMAHAALRAQAGLRDVPARELPTHQSKCAQGSVVVEVRGPSTDVVPAGPYRLPYPSCQVVVGGPGPNVYDHDVGLVVDLGGRDVYRNNAGAWSPSAFGCDSVTVSNWNGASMARDLGSADDTYNATRAPFEGTQGSGIFGHGFLMDAGGNDTYVAREGAPTACSFISAQGTGFWGTGMLWDRGTGNDTYRSPDDAQGVGRLGSGLLLDGGGSDAYRIDPVTFDTEATQGMGCVGVGMLVDRGLGDDLYRSAGADTQGMGCLGGLGLLADGGGSDTYTIRTAPGRVNGEKVNESGWGQGYGELGAVGLLLDEDGNDTYGAERQREVFRSGFFVQGVGLAGGFGLLRDGSGDDAYRAGRRAQGGAQGSALGVLSDSVGDDLYSGFRRCQGWAGEPGYTSTGSLALLTDGAGSDTYRCGTAPDWGERGDGHIWISSHGLETLNATDDALGPPLDDHAGIGLDRNGTQAPPEILEIVGGQPPVDPPGPPDAPNPPELPPGEEPEPPDPPPGNPTDVADDDGDGVPDGYEPLICYVENYNDPADGTCHDDGSDYSPPWTR